MDITKKQFIIFILSMFALAGLIAFALPPERTDTQNYLTSDAIYLILCYGLAFFFLKEEAIVPGVLTIYGGSILFCFIYFFIAPVEAPIMLVLFVWPAILFQKKKIGCLNLAILGAILMFVSFNLLGRPAVFALLFPVCHLISMRFSPNVNARFSGNIYDMGNLLSQKQKRLRSGKSLSEKADWWAILKPELENIIQTVMAKYGKEAGNQPETSKKLFDPKLLQLQDSFAMSKALTELKKRDNNFDSNQFLKKVDKIFLKVQKAWYEQKSESVQHMISDALYEQLKCQEEEQKANGIKFTYKDMVIQNTRIAQVNSDQNFDVIHVFIRANSRDSIIDLETNEVLAENEENRDFAEYWTFLRRPTAKTLNKPDLLSSSCPNCGNPIKIGQVTVCEICKSYLRSGEYDWVLAKITQAGEWEYTEPSRLPDWDKVKEMDPDFTIQAIEDLGGVIFWKTHQAERMKKPEIIKRFTTEILGKNFSKVRSQNCLNCNYVENISLGSVRLRGFKIGEKWDKIFLLVSWNGVPVRLDSSGKTLPDKRMNRIFRDLFVLTRKHGAKSNLKNAITSSHCPSCGANTESSFATSCEYCGSSLNEGSKSWILEKVTTERDGEYLDSISRPRKKISDDECLSTEQRSARDIVTITAQLLLADGVIDPDEVNLLNKIASSHGMSQKDVDSIIENLKSGLVYIPAPKDNRQSWELLLHATRMALADGTIDDSEEKSLISLAKHIGYTEMDVKRARKVEEKSYNAQQRQKEMEARKKARQ